MKVNTLIDCGSSRFAFIEETILREHKHLLYKLKIPRMVKVIDGGPIKCRDFEHQSKLLYTIQDCLVELQGFITQSVHYHLVLGILLLQHHKVTFDFRNGKFKFVEKKVRAPLKPRKLY